MGHRWDALSRAYDVLAFEAATDADEVFRGAGAGTGHRAGQQAGQPASVDRSRHQAAVVSDDEAGVRPPTRGGRRWRRLVRCMPGWGRASLVLYHVSTLYFQTDAGPTQVMGFVSRAVASETLRCTAITACSSV